MSGPLAPAPVRFVARCVVASVVVTGFIVAAGMCAVALAAVLFALVFIVGRRTPPPAAP